MRLVTPVNIKKEDLNFDSVNTLFLIDIMHMRELNEAYGYESGNKIIRQFSSLFLNNVIPKIEQLLARFKIEKNNIEFKNHYVDIFALKLFCELDERIILKIKSLIVDTFLTEQFYIEDHGVNINIDITIGCSQGLNNDELTVYAEKALYNAKENYENYSYCDDSLSGNTMINNNLLDIMRYNIDEKMVEPFFQEIVDNKKLKTHKYEALMRLYGQAGEYTRPLRIYGQGKEIQALSQAYEDNDRKSVRRYIKT